MHDHHAPQPGRRDDQEDLRPDPVPRPPRCAAAATSADGERSLRRQPRANIGEPLQPVRRDHDRPHELPGIAGALDREHGAHLDLRRPVRAAAAARPPGLGLELEPVAPPALALLGLLGADAGLGNYQNLLPIIAPTLANIDDADLPLALQILAGSGNFDGDGQYCEAQNLIAFGQGLNAFALPPQYGGIDRSAFFDSPHDLFIVVYLQPLARRCALPSDACNINGRSPTDIFLDTDGNGGVTWLSFSSGTTISPSQVVQVAIATAEGQSQTDFETTCTAVTGFPLNLFDDIGPSPNAYFTPLMAALNAANPGTGQSADFCQLIGSMPTAAIQKLGASVATLATSH